MDYKKLITENWKYAIFNQKFSSFLRKIAVFAFIALVLASVAMYNTSFNLQITTNNESGKKISTNEIESVVKFFILNKNNVDTNNTFIDMNNIGDIEANAIAEINSSGQMINTKKVDISDLSTVRETGTHEIVEVKINSEMRVITFIVKSSYGRFENVVIVARKLNGNWLIATVETPKRTKNSASPYNMPDTMTIIKNHIK